jgi:hypothetical protein
MAIHREVITASGAAGGAGAATATAVSSRPIDGRIMAVHVAYLESPPGATTDVTIQEANNSPAMPILTIANAATDAWFYPMAQADNQAGADITGMGAPIAVNDYVRATIAQANDGDGVTVTIVWDDGR